LTIFFFDNLYDGLNVIIERDQHNLTQASYTRGLGYGGGIGSIISRTSYQSPVASYYFHYDGIGAVTKLTNSDGRVAQSYTYDAYGNLLKAKGKINNLYRFSTKELLPKSGLIYFGARYYDPRIGRFITPDPLTWGPDDPRLFGSQLHPPFSSFQIFLTVGNGGVIDPDSIVGLNLRLKQARKEMLLLVGGLTPQLQHRFTYAFNNPVNFIDPYGLEAELKKLMREFRQLFHRLVFNIMLTYAIPGGLLMILGGVLVGAHPVIGMALLTVGGTLEVIAVVQGILWAKDFADWWRKYMDWRERQMRGVP